MGQFPIDDGTWRELLRGAGYEDYLRIAENTLRASHFPTRNHLSGQRADISRIELGIGWANIPLLLLELFQFVCCVLIFGIELEGFAIVGDGILFSTVLGICFGQAVIDVA